MKIIKYLMLECLLLLILIACGVFVVKISELIFGMEFENSGTTGFIAGLSAWNLLLLIWFLKSIRNRQEKSIQ